MGDLRWKNPQKVAVELGALCEMQGTPESALFHHTDGRGVPKLKSPSELFEEGVLPESVWRCYVC